MTERATRQGCGDAPLVVAMTLALLAGSEIPRRREADPHGD
jgi:hypothetical protein